MRKWLMSKVLPGVCDVLARPLMPVSMLMSDDLPTLLRPMNAYSGLLPPGHFSTCGLLISYFALFIFIVFSHAV